MQAAAHRPTPVCPLQTLYSFAGDFRAFKALIAAQYNGVDIATPEFDLATDGKKEEFLAKSPLGKVPLLDTPKGECFMAFGFVFMHLVLKMAAIADTFLVVHVPLFCQVPSTRATPLLASSLASVPTPT